MSARSKRTIGFTLLEILAVITIIGIVSGTVLPRITGSTTKGKVRVCHQFRAELNAAAERLFVETGAWPASVDDLDVEDYFPDGVPKLCPLTNAAYTFDPALHRILGHDHSGL